MSLELVFAVRHGPHDAGVLTSEGARLVGRLATRLRKLIPRGCPVAIISSTVPRAVESATIIASEFEVAVKVNSVLESGSADVGELVAETLEGLTGDAGAVIVVTHAGTPSGIINGFARRLGKTFKHRVCPLAGGHLINIGSGDIAPDIFK